MPAVAVHGPATAPAIVMLHSLGSDRTMWRPQVEALSDRWRVVVVETRGHGGSTTPPGPWTLDDLGRDVLAVADHLGLDTFHLCGLSLGGLVALWVAVHHHDRLRSLTVANTAARVGTADGWRARADAVRSRGLAGIRSDVLARFFAPGFADRDPDAHREAESAFVAADDEGYARCCEVLAVADLRPDVASIRVPTLVVGGAADVATPPEEAEQLHAAVPGSRLVVLDGAAHLSNLERPEAFTAALVEHTAAVEHERTTT